MERMPGLRVISNFGVGCDHIDLEGARRLGIPVGNTPGVLDATTADMTFTLLMAAARNVVRGDHFARGPDFIEYDPSFLLGQEVAGSIMGSINMIWARAWAPREGPSIISTGSHESGSTAP
mgnify:CR=1 FL=1